MRICIPIQFAPHGGGHYFLKMFEEYLEKFGWTVSRDLTTPADVLFTNHWMTSRRDILKALRVNTGVRIVQRIDGAAQDYGRDPEADLRQASVNNLADLTIFQSQYCRFSTREKFRVIRRDGPVIYNPVDIEIFSPEGPRYEIRAKNLIACVSWSTNPLKGAQKIYAVALANPKIHFVLCGNYPDAPDLPNLHKLGVLGRHDLAATLRSCDILLTFSQNEACPNHVLEALGCGLPILYQDSGAMQEVVGECGLAVNTETFKEQYARIKSSLAELSVQSRKRVLDHFNPDVVFPRYIEVIESAITKPTHVSLFRRRLTALTGF